ncbi:hypothetical protein [Nocardia donostiensis]|uniref:Uncharacterized protein n=1 Tax=Nocardia donostiensis TaxID=1538463 RepID=A0A1W0B8N9_9NOCA|nr:hypothetical protein [Nocardia donostiensis]ONM50490.1 hypothetical protein B0T46_00790 [Nocardia donostiensis]OQS17273.1 hypothetical protein B0T36_01360 [Nocardia donostiensis]OQS18854.1 hypothetical protein B0T44_17210 [Nocardia donostiensis]
MPGLLVLFVVAASVTFAVVGAIYTLPHARADYEDGRPMSLGEAHSVMQWHRDCALDCCERKRAAARTLYLAGRFIPDQRIERFVR